jgi:hypothetical protein
MTSAHQLAPAPAKIALLSINYEGCVLMYADADGTIVAASPMCIGLLDKHPMQLVGASIYELVETADLLVVERCIEQHEWAVVRLMDMPSPGMIFWLGMRDVTLSGEVRHIIRRAQALASEAEARRRSGSATTSPPAGATCPADAIEQELSYIYSRLSVAAS